MDITSSSGHVVDSSCDEYSLSAMDLPFGDGLNYEINDNFNILQASLCQSDSMQTIACIASNAANASIHLFQRIRQRINPAAITIARRDDECLSSKKGRIAR